jgi:hypothetical protein
MYEHAVVHNIPLQMFVEFIDVFPLCPLILVICILFLYFLLNLFRGLSILLIFFKAEFHLIQFSLLISAFTLIIPLLLILKCNPPLICQGLLIGKLKLWI